jgi:hypothetical protein
MKKIVLKSGLYTISKKSKSEVKDYSKIIDEIVQNPEKFNITEEDEYYIENGSYYKLDNALQLSVVFEEGVCYINAYLEKNYLMMYEMSCHPIKKGYGKKTLQFLRDKFGDKIGISAIDVIDETRAMWEEMYNKGLIDEYI